jgi:EmrB/QacA subfamily drug resistance transporter
MKEKQNSASATLWVIAAVQFLTPFMFSAIGVALPAIGREFAAGAVQLGLVEMVYILGVALFLLPVGRFADIHGRRKIYLAGIILMTLATLALALAPTIETLILFRFFQGIGASMITSTSFAIITSIFPQDQRGRAMGIVVSAVYLGISAGPTLAGLMISYLGWRWIFYSAIPVELAALVFALLRLKGEWAGARGERFDWIGSLLYMTALSALIVGTVKIREYQAAGWLAGGGLAGMAVFLLFEAKTASPLLPLQRILANRVFFYSNLATWLNYAASFGIMFFFSLYLQIIKGMPPKTTGFILIIQPLIQAICAPYAGRLADRHRPAPIATAGMALCTLGLLVSAMLTASSSFAMIYSVLILMGLGFGFFSTPNTTAIMASISPRDYGMASSLIATMRTTGMLTCMTVITLLLGHFLGDRPVAPETGAAFMAAMQSAMLIFSLMGLLAIAFSLGRTSPLSRKEKAI